jgi:hypothetical protein
MMLNPSSALTACDFRPSAGRATHGLEQSPQPGQAYRSMPTIANAPDAFKLIGGVMQVDITTPQYPSAAMGNPENSSLEATATEA